MNENAERHLSAGFEIIVGLKDIYGKRYTDIAGHKIVQRKMEELMATQRASLKTGNLKLCFAIMEVEAWILGMQTFLEREYPGIVLPYSNDPQAEICHPFRALRQSLNAVGVTYDKHVDEIMSLISKISQYDFDALYASSRCGSFKEFYDTLILRR